MIFRLSEKLNTEIKAGTLATFRPACPQPLRVCSRRATDKSVCPTESSIFPVSQTLLSGLNPAFFQWARHSCLAFWNKLLARRCVFTHQSLKTLVRTNRIEVGFHLKSLHVFVPIFLRLPQRFDGATAIFLA
jgi:hypothetical protein